jgi:antitoxin CptB
VEFIGAETLDHRRKRLLYRSHHRGMLEMDYLLGAFCDQNMADLSDEQVDCLEALMEEADDVVCKWFLGQEPVPEAHHTDLFKMIRNFKNDSD